MFLPSYLYIFFCFIHFPPNNNIRCRREAYLCLVAVCRWQRCNNAVRTPAVAFLRRGGEKLHVAPGDFTSRTTSRALSYNGARWDYGDGAHATRLQAVHISSHIYRGTRRHASAGVVRGS
ncbi:hypothetical protein, unlikely [Trypanosoma brucei brucei TREU927]|uniref:Uncharacterized protein n=1 Tax=Trypanosoma brucei brucei (strain 927/4 GUTat10.1) TaxID=185431 RepID=Q389J2_TRYB2|nr:hypothetical protein, unlikely [Trypanosoma brucei brucei TREU927]EAN78528.1 hypothetical protein, unlikely [Trypanosoma brucei brucei TREU927]